MVYFSSLFITCACMLLTSYIHRSDDFSTRLLCTVTIKRYLVKYDVRLGKSLCLCVLLLFTLFLSKGDIRESGGCTLRTSCKYIEIRFFFRYNSSHPINCTLLLITVETRDDTNTHECKVVALTEYMGEQRYTSVTGDW